MDNRIQVLQHGFIELEDSMGSDKAIAHNAWLSTGKTSEDPAEIRKLLAHLIAEDHTSPLERVEFVFRVKLPIFVARQWVRHRMAEINEYSGRYSPMLKEFEVPEELSDSMRTVFGDVMKEQYDVYEAAMRDMQAGGEKRKRSRETARGVLGTGYYTEWTWKANLHSVMHFLYLRRAEDAQAEIKAYADAMDTLIAAVVPISHELITQANQLRWIFKKIRRQVLCKSTPVSEVEKLTLDWLELKKET